MSSNNWIGDGSNGILSVKGDLITLEAEKVGTPFNVRLGTGATVGSPDLCSYHVKIQELSANISVGVVTEAEFQPGWKIKGMFYNGNVTNGSAALITKFGPYVKAGDTVGCQLRYHADKQELESNFFVNGKAIGTAFCLQKINPDQIFYPCIVCSGSAKFQFAANDFVELRTTKDSSSSDCEDYAGDWKVKSLTAAGTDITLPGNHDIIVSFQGSPPAFISVKVGNTLAGPIEIVGTQDDANKTPGKTHKVQIGLLRSTKMLPAPELRNIETILSNGLPNLNQISISNGDLHMSGGGANSNADLELTAARYIKRQKILTTYLH